MRLISLLLCVAALPQGLRCTPETENALAMMVQSDPVATWHKSASGAAQAAVAAALKQYQGLEVREVDLQSLHVRHGHVLDLALEVGGNVVRFYSGAPESDAEWSSLTDTLPAAQGGILPQGDWDSLERNWVRPVQAGPSLPDFTLTGPLDIFITPHPAQLQLWLPHPVDAGRLRRVLLREGAAVTVRGAGLAELRRPVDLPSVSLTDFANIATLDKEQRNAAGLLHLAAGLREEAAKRWNGTAANGTSPALVAVNIEMAEGAGILLAAPSDGGSLQRLRVRKLSEGVIELSARDVLSTASSKALALAAMSPYAWPLRSADPQTLQSYEHLLREVLASEIFGGSGRHRRASGRPRLSSDVPLRLQKSSARALMLLRMELEVARPSKEVGGDGGNVAALPSPQELIMRSVTGSGTRGSTETWSAVLQVEGNAAEGLRFVPVRLQPLHADRETTTWAPDAFQGNFTLPEMEWLPAE